MASIRDLRTRIRSVGSIRQITRAMEMVATTKLRRFQDRAVASRPYAQEIARLLDHTLGVLGEDLGERPLFRAGTGAVTAVALVGSDRGLCGAYNSNIFRALEEWISQEPDRPLAFFVYGRKGYQYLQKRGLHVERYVVDPPLEQVDYRLAKNVARGVRERFLSGKYAEVRLLHTAYESAVRFVPTWTTLLPIRRPHGAPTPARDAILEPSVETLVERLVPRYLETLIYNALLEALTSEYASRRISMKNATEAATEMQGLLRKQYNRKRQEGITKELLDIVGGAEALR